MTRRRILRDLTLAAKLVLTVLLGAYVVSRVDLSGAWASIAAVSAADIAIVAAILAAQIVFGSIRLRYVLQLLHSSCSFVGALRNVLIGGFFSQVLFTIVAGDGMRIWFLHRDGVQLRTAASAVTLDRLLGFVSFLVLVGASMVPLAMIVVDPWLRVGIIAALVFGLVALGAFLAMQLMPLRWQRLRVVAWLAEVARQGHQLLARGRVAVPLLGLGLAVHLASVLVVYAFARGLDFALGLGDALILVPVPILLSMLPISIGGWGVREGAMMVALGLAGLSAEQGLTLSVLFGLSAIVAALPGGMVWLLARRRGALPASATTAQPAESITGPRSAARTAAGGRTDPD